MYRCVQVCTIAEFPRKVIGCPRGWTWVGWHVHSKRYSSSLCHLPKDGDLEPAVLGGVAWWRSGLTSSQASAASRFSREVSGYFFLRSDPDALLTMLVLDGKN